MTLSFVYHVDLPETWKKLKKALGQLAPKNTLLSQLLGKVLLHSISTGIQHAGALPDEKKAKELRTFLTTTADLNLGETADGIMRDAKRGVLFREEAALSEADCGRECLRSCGNREDREEQCELEKPENNGALA